jgi:glycosyltransferase involved in cell wall biosynthesis
MSAAPVQAPGRAFAPDFTLRSLEPRGSDAYRSLCDWRGRRVLLVFIQPDCPHSRPLLPAIAGLMPDPPAAIPVSIIVTTGTEAQNRQLVETYRIRCPVLLQDAAEVASLYLTEETPAGCLIDESGRMIDMTRTGNVDVLVQAGIMPGPGWDWSTTPLPSAGGGDEQLVRRPQGGKPKLLYQSPVMPSFNGPGVCLRAAMILEALAEHYDVSLMVITLWEDFAGPISARIAALCNAWTVVRAVMVIPGYSGGPVPTLPVSSLWQCASEETRREAGARFRGIKFDVIHSFSLPMALYAQQHLADGGRPAWHLDLDNIESRVRRRIADRHRASGRKSDAAAEEEEATRLAAMEAEILPRCDRVYACSRQDRESLQQLYHLENVAVLPNAVRIPLELPPKPSGDAFTFLFAGRLDYFPNQDAVLFFCNEVVPQLRRHARRAFEILIVGGGNISEELHEVSHLPEVELVGAVKRLEPWYQRADGVLAPILAGGGTRIKILEAMIFRRPIVSTSLGIEGLDVIDDEHVLVADTPRTFAAQCMRLMDEPDLADRLTTSAFALCVQRYTPEAIRAALKSVHARD